MANSLVKKGKLRLLRDPDLTDSEESSSDDEFEEEEESEESEVEQQEQKQKEQQEIVEQKTKQIDTFWCWESNDGYKPYDPSVSKKLEELKINQVYKLHINATPYEIKKTAFDQAIQTNLTTQLYRKAIRKSNNNNNNNNHNHNNNNNKIKELEYVWYYTNEYGQMESCSYDISLQLNKLNINGLYTTHIDGTQYQFKKTANDLCSERNISSNTVRSVIRQSVNKHNHHKNNNHKNNNHHHHHNNNNYNNKWNKRKWNWETDMNSWTPFSNYISSKLDGLKVGKSMTITIENRQYEMTKITWDACLQKNTKSGKTRQVRLK